MNKFSKKYIYYHLLMDLAYSFFMIVVIFMNVMPTDPETGETIFDSTVLLISLFAWIAIYIIMTIYHILFYKTARYEFNDKGIICHRGVLIKKKSFLEYKKIHTVNKKQNLFQQLFDVSSLLIDSGSTKNASNAEINIIEDTKTVDILMNKIKIYQEGKQELENNIEENISINTEEIKYHNLYNFTSKRKFIYSLLNTLSSIIVTFIILSFIFVVIPILISMAEESEVTAIDIIIYGVIFYLLTSVASFFTTIINSFIAFYDFKIYKNKNAVEISYGLLVKNNNTFHLDRLKAVKIKQGLIKRLFGFASIDVEVIGYGEFSENEKNKSRSVLIPLCKKSEINDYIMQIFGEEYIPVEKENKAKAFFPLVSWKLLITFLICIIPAILAAPWLIHFNETFVSLLIFIVCFVMFAIIAIIFIIDAIFKYRNEGISINDKNITIYHGGINVETTIFLKRHIIAVEDVTTPLQNKKGITTYHVHFRSNALTNESRVDIIDQNVKEKLINSVRF